MKRILLAAALTGAMIASTAAQADQRVFEGTILAPSPWGTGLVSELVNACNSIDPELEGIDAAWFGVSEGEAVAVEAKDGFSDFDAYFYDAGCNYLDEGLANDGDEFGEVPEGAANMVVILFLGANADYKVTIG